MEKNEIPYWISLAHLSRWGAARINSVVIKFFHEHQISIQDFFDLEKDVWKDRYGLMDQDVADLDKARAQVAGNAFLAETLLNEGYEIIPITSPDYSPSLKSNLKASHSPVILYIKGNKQLLKDGSVAIVGSREAADISLRFTDNIARMAVQHHKVVVSGFAKGVDRRALDSSIAANGQSIIVLPQGILTFSSGFREYYRQIVSGKVLVLSTFLPKAAWQRELAMARNPIIYGLANEIYVAESGEQGGTWAGVIDGLRKKRRIFVRQPDSYEHNANALLIRKGAIPVDLEGKQLELTVDDGLVMEGEEGYQPMEPLKEKILSVFNGKPLTAKEILDKLNLDLTSQKLHNVLKSLAQIEIIKTKKPYKFRLKDKFDHSQQKSLFE
jgi:predicted Rossmann fold nucleotide-binding protein DprA/Smf involved in DNA uptake